MIGNFVDAVIGHPGDDDTRIGCGCNIHVVYADSKASDDSTSRHLPDHLGC